MKPCCPLFSLGSFLTSQSLYHSVNVGFVSIHLYHKSRWKYDETLGDPMSPYPLNTNDVFAAQPCNL